MALKWCCCCVPLRTGALAISILYLVVNIGVWLGTAVWLIAELVEYGSTEDDNRLKIVGYIIQATWFFCIINILMNRGLVKAIRSNRRKLMLGWMVWNGIFNILATLPLLAILTWFLVKYDAKKNPYINETVVVGCVLFVSLPVMWYWYACVVSYYRLLAPSDVHGMEAPRDQEASGTLLSGRPVEQGGGLAGHRPPRRGNADAKLRTM